MGTQDYINYYRVQSGYGLRDIGPIYSSPIFYQKGSGIGSFFSGLFRYLRPAISSGLNALKNQSIKTGTAILQNMNTKPIKDILKEQGKIAIQDLAQKGVNKLTTKLEQLGSGYGCCLPKKGIKRKFRNPSVQSKKKAKHSSVIKISKKSKNSKKKIKNKIRVLDIFDGQKK